MTRIRGFTLIELTVALVVTGLVAVLVYGVADVAHDTRQRLGASRKSLQTARAMRTLLQDALRNARPVALGETAFTLEDRRGTSGQPADRLVFVTAGGSAPLTAGRDWLVRVAPTAEGLVFTAAPLDASEGGRFVGQLAGVTGLEARVKRAGKDTTWATRWLLPSAVPQAVELTYWTDTSPIGLPLVVALPLGSVR